ncbi:hypothetical protein BC937DRAFT_94279 [Endogone sp. FLAS-F59071]|nr:hypothetical protein BC937DRAFT_94279 [Endogone sp. FLAS-F59071]|eukprot:RUS20830.1 hypothetical protein BC937DRAFT_94279 [Endogone sp. FLAS-F59071]
MAKSKGKYTSRSQSRPSGLASKKPHGRKAGSSDTLKYGQLSRKQKESLQEYGELVPKDFEDEDDEDGEEGKGKSEATGPHGRRRIVTEAELDRQASLKRHAEEQAAHMEENDKDDVSDDEWQQPSAYSKLIGLLQKDKDDGAHKRRKFGEEITEDIEIGSESSEEEDAEEVELTKAQIKMLERRFGVEYIERLEVGDVDPDELIAALEEDNMGGKKATKDKMPKDGEREEEKTGEGESENMDIEIEEEADHDEQGDEEQGQDRDDADDDDDFSRHFSNSGPDNFNARITIAEGKHWVITPIEDPILGQAVLQTTEAATTKHDSTGDRKDLAALHVKRRLRERWADFNTKCMMETNEKPISNLFTPLQHHLFRHMNQYCDVLFCSRTHLNAREIRHSYALHALNHVIKTRDRVLKNNQRISKAQSENKDIDISEIRDQGFTRPKILIILPFRNTVVDVVKSLIQLSGSDQQEQKKRFLDDFDSPEPEAGEDDPDKPADHVAAFRGNVDDHFRLGIKFTRKTVKLYADFYSADIVIASPLGLRTIIGAEGDKKRDFDYLSSIEVVILDQTQMFLMQNWDHIEHIFDHLNCIPKVAHGCDFSRVKNWYLDGRAKNLRQTLIFSDFLTPEINALFNKHCRNVSGRIKVRPEEYTGSIVDVIPQVQQTFTRIESQSLTDEADVRFKYFIEKTLPSLRKSAINQSHTLIFIPSYFDFVRLRNYLEDGKCSFGQICEYVSSTDFCFLVCTIAYTTTSDVSRARSNFFHGRVNFLLYTERFHFFRRYNIRGTHQIVFYALPDNPRFYAEVVNFLMLKSAGVSAAEESTFSCSALFSKYDALKLERIVGTERARRMCAGARNVFTFA